MTSSGIDIVESLTYPGGERPNEDAVGWADKAAWVIDGATPVTPNLIDPASDARWLAQEVDRVLRNASRPIGTMRPRDVVALVAEEVDASLRRAQFPEEALPPACSMGFVQMGSKSIRASIIGDVSIYLPNANLLLSDPRFGRNESSARERHREETLEQDSVRNDIAHRRRSYIYGPGAMHVLSRSPRAAEGVRSKTVQVQPGDTVIIMSDGFARLCEDYALFPGYAEMARFVGSEGLDAAYALLRSYEREHRSDTRAFKRADDASALLARVAG